VSIKRIVNATVAAAAVGIVTVIVMSAGSSVVNADDRDSHTNLAKIGLSIAPAFINMQGLDRELVGLGSYIVNAQADCNGCHGSDPANEFLPTNNPYFLAPNNYPAVTNQATYLNGGQNFGTVGPGVVQDVNSPLYAGPGLGPNIITRNLTPDYTGNPAGGLDLGMFINVLRTGHDYDHLHLNCSATVTDNCYNPPVNGAVLQVMPWPKFRHMTDYELTAVWTYLRAVPCNPHNDALGGTFPWLRNKCN
jgi:hypothetical protein